MTIALLRFRCSLSCVVSLGFALSISMPAAFLTGCGGSSPHGTTFSGNTRVTVLATSTANAQMTRFNATINSVTLTDQAGDTVNLISSPIYPEFMHLNGIAEPLVTTNIPQGIYTTATASFGATSFTCETRTPDGGLDSSIFTYGYVPTPNVTVTLPAPMTITGDTMVLALNLDVPKSASYTGCYVKGIEPFAITPTLDITPVSLSPQPANSNNGLLRGLAGIVASVNSADSSFTVNSADGSNYGGGSPNQVADPANGPVWQMKANTGTVYEGISDFSKLAVGMPVNMDAVIQADGSVLASHVAVHDTNTSTLSLWTGPLLYVNKFEPVLYTFGQDQIGPILGSGATPFDFSSAAFGISGQIGNTASLPFHATFNSKNMVVGQNVEMTFHAPNFPYSPNHVYPATITPLPQTINGTVSAVSSESGFKVYTVSLASYDLFPTFAIQGGQTTLLPDPGTVTVYADDKTQLLSAGSPSAGSLVRFRGLVFNDSGSLRMDCAEIEDGVSQDLSLTPPNPNGKAMLSTSPETRSHSFSIPALKR